MTRPDPAPRDPAIARYYLIVAARMLGVAGAVLGLVIAARAADTALIVLGIALVLASLWVMAVLPLALARRWRTPPGG